MKRITLISTGGTIEKTYDERTGTLTNRRSIVDTMLSALRLEDISINSIQLLSKDSQDFTHGDRKRILDMVRVMTEGRARRTDRRGHPARDGHAVGDRRTAPQLPVRERRRGGRGRPRGAGGADGRDAPLRDEAVGRAAEPDRGDLRGGGAPPGVYAVAHGRALAFPGVVKDIDAGDVRA
jgi:L-asparaginase